MSSDNNGVSGLHNSHSRVIASQSFALTSISFKDLLPLYETIGGSLNILLSNSDNDGLTGLHNSYPRVIAALKVLLELVYL